MEALRAPRGLIVDLITPLNKDGGIDGRGLGRHLDRIVPHVQAVLLAGPEAGEGRHLTTEQRSDLLEKALVVVRGRVPLMIWITQETAETTRQTLLSLKKTLGKRKYHGDLFWVDTPLYYHSNRGLADHYQEMSATVDEPFILHNDPELIKILPAPLKRSNIRTAILKELSALPPMVGLIYLGTLDRAYNYQKACRGRTYFKIYDGDEAQFLDHPSMGGVVSAGANLEPRAWARIIRSSLQLTGMQGSYPDSLQQVWEMGQRLRDLRDLYCPGPAPVVKAVLSDMGRIETPACASPVEPPEEAKDRVKELVAPSGA